MIHYSCDRCGRPIDCRDEVRYVLRVEVEAVMESLDDEVVDDADRDHLMEIQEILDRGEDIADPLIGDGVYKRRRFDLCSECHRKFLKNPLGQEPISQMDFSQN